MIGMDWTGVPIHSSKIGLNCTYENIKNSLIMGVYYVDIFIREKIQ